MNSVREVQTDTERADAFDVRHTVFVDEQGVPEDLEVDEHDETATHFVAYDGENAVGAARLRRLDDTSAKAERVAVLADRRKEGWGRKLMDCLEATASDRGFERMKLNSQTHAAPFYDRLGYERVGEEFEEAGIPHVEMVKQL